VGDEPGPARQPSAEVVAVGSELLLGESVDTNSAWLSARLAEVGLDVFRHTTVGDNLSRIAAVLEQACSRADAVLVTGGLGPTQDDLTRLAVARLAGVELERRPELVAYITRSFAERRRDMPENNLLQADLPAGARVLEPVGTAAGFVMELPAEGGHIATLYCMPGVPAEMRVMMSAQVLPELTRRFGLATTVSRLVRIAGMAESAVAEACGDLIRRLDTEAAARGSAANPTVAFLASRGETRVRVTGKAASREAALALLDPVVDEIIGLLGTGVVGVDDEGVEQVVARQLRRAGWGLAVGESLTGGGVGARLVTVAGASEWFRGGLVTYATTAKTALAGVPAELLERHGPVSEETAVALAAGARDRLGADVGLGIVGVAGPTTQDDAALGTVCLGFVAPGGVCASRVVHLPGRSRVAVQEFAASAALDYLRRRLAALA
jgi:nicotinamide-nucleotide amidase